MALRLLVKSAVFILSFMLISAFAFASQEKERSPDVKSIISNIAEAYGGKGAVENIKTVYARGKISALMRQDNGEYVMYFRRDRMLRLELSYSRSSETRVLNSGRGWRGADRGPLIEVSDNRYLAMVFQYKRLDLPYGLLTDRYKITHAGTAVINGMNVTALELTDGEGPPMKMYIDENFHIVKVSGFFRINEFTSELSAEYSDFRVIEGVPFPYRIVNYASGHKVGETIIDTYSVNTAMDASLFKPREP